MDGYQINISIREKWLWAAGFRGGWGRWGSASGESAGRQTLPRNSFHQFLCVIIYPPILEICLGTMTCYDSALLSFPSSDVPLKSSSSNSSSSGSSGSMWLCVWGCGWVGGWEKKKSVQGSAILSNKLVVTPCKLPILLSRESLRDF